MSFIVIDIFGGLEYASIVTNEEGENKVFSTRELAQAEADDCQEAIIIEA